MSDPSSEEDPVVEAEVVAPEPETTGVSPEQGAAATADTDALQELALSPASHTGGLGILSVAGVIQRLSHGVTGTAARMLLQVSTARIEAELEEATTARDAERRSSEEWKEKWHEKDKSTAVLQTKLGIATEVQVVSSILTTIGGIAVGVGGTQLWVLGGLVLALGWIWPYVNRRRT
jgi:hypothetical protein